MTTTISPADLEDLIQHLEDCDVINDVRTDYSGRGMYGATCLGFTTSEPENLMMEIGTWLHLREEADDDFDLRLPFTRSATDSMGLSTIIYWPSMQVGS